MSVSTYSRDWILLLNSPSVLLFYQPQGAILLRCPWWALSAPFATSSSLLETSFAVHSLRLLASSWPLGFSLLKYVCTVNSNLCSILPVDNKHIDPYFLLVINWKINMADIKNKNSVRPSHRPPLLAELLPLRMFYSLVRAPPLSLKLAHLLFISFLIHFRFSWSGLEYFLIR